MSTQPLKQFIDQIVETATEHFGYRPYLQWMQRWRVRAAAFAAGMAAEWARIKEDGPIDIAPNLCCPGCGSHKHLGRIEGVLGLALIDVKSRSGKRYSFAGETKVEWDTQSRERCKDLPEFHCLRCHHEFNVPGAKCAEEGT